MGVFNTIFGSKENKKQTKENKKNIHWIPLTSLNQLKEIINKSKTESVFIFKHSTRCVISKMVIKQFENLFLEKHKNLKIYYLDLLSHRDISNEIAELFQVTHQSPQLIVVKNEVSVYEASHSEITEINLSTFI